MWCARSDVIIKTFATLGTAFFILFLLCSSTEQLAPSGVPLKANLILIEFDAPLLGVVLVSEFGCNLPLASDDVRRGKSGEHFPILGNGTD